MEHQNVASLNLSKQVLQGLNVVNDSCHIDIEAILHLLCEPFLGSCLFVCSESASFHLEMSRS